MAPKDVAPGLWLIGIGPGDIDHMTSKAKRIARGCRKRYLEGYTAAIPPEQEALLEDVVGPWERLMRPSVEKPEVLLEEAREQSVALLVVGDPMQATTHIDLEARCMEQGVGFEVVPGMSATSLAVSLSGMQSYKFGRQVTLPYPYGEYLVTSPMEMILSNRNSGLHSLVLLDLDPTGLGFDLPTPMSPAQALSILERMSKKILEDSSGLEDLNNIGQWDAVLLSDVGTSKQRVSSGTLSEIGNLEDGWLHTLIIPAKMTDNEKGAFFRRAMT